MSAPLRIAVAGAGRMGQAVVAAITKRRNGTELAGIWTRGSDLGALVAAADVVIDFSLPEGTERVIEAVVRHGKPLVCGVSGLNSTQLEALGEAAAVVPLVYERNMSRGITVLDDVLRRVGDVLGSDFSVAISETHHAHKKDAPSGTALMLRQTLARVRGVPAVEIPIDSERRDEVPGDHTVTFQSATERLTLTHSVSTRDVFAEGALCAAEWIVARPAGQYSMRDVLLARA